MLSDLTIGPTFKVKQWFTGFGELSFRWIQICIGSPIHNNCILCEPLFVKTLRQLILSQFRGII